jgi:hypothetical protein
MKSFLVAVSLVALLGAGLGENRALAGNLVLNSSFETLDWGPQPFTDWTVILGFTQYLFPNSPAHTGSWAAYFAATHHADDTLLQLIPTTPGTTYTLDFWLMNSFAYGNPDNDFSVLWNGSPLLSLVNAPYTGYTHYMFNVSATDSQTELRFVGANSPSAFLLDDVSVMAVCEPSSLALLGLGGIASAIAVATRRAKQGR